MFSPLGSQPASLDVLLMFAAALCLAACFLGARSQPQPPVAIAAKAVRPKKKRRRRVAVKREEQAVEEPVDEPAMA